MGALTYLFFTKQKNRLKEYFRSPSKIMWLVAVIALFAMSFYMRSSGIYDDGMFRSQEEFFAIVGIVYTMVFLNISKSGFSNGGTFFSLSDVNLIFVSPVKSTSALFYGIVQQLGSSLFLGAFILFQYSLSYQLYGIGFFTIVIVALGYGITVLLSQMCSMLIYIFTSSSDKKASIGKVIYYSVFSVFVVYFLVKADVFTSLSLQSLVDSLRSPAFTLVPVSGIVTLLVEGISTFNAVKSIIAVISVVAFAVLFYFVISKTKGEYYEDVLKSAESTYTAITAAREGKNAEITVRNIRTGKIGLGKTFGASAIRAKHRIENRRSRVIFLNRTSLVTVGTTLVYSFFIKDSPMTVFIMSLYSMAVTVSAGRWMKEITMPYIYLIPEKPFKKLINVIYEQIPSVIWESIVCYVPLHFILSLTVRQTVLMMIARSGFGLIFIASNLIYLKVMKKNSRSFLTITVYMLIAMLMSMPGLITAFIANMYFWYLGGIGFLLSVPVNIIVFLIILFFSRNILECAQFNKK